MEIKIKKCLGKNKVLFQFSQFTWIVLGLGMYVMYYE